MHESVVFCTACTMSSYERLRNRSAMLTLTLSFILVAVQYCGLASSQRKFTFAISSPDEFLVRNWTRKLQNWVNNAKYGHYAVQGRST